MAKGGYRPGAGRPKKVAEKVTERAIAAVLANASYPEVATNVEVPEAVGGERLTPLEFMLRVMNDPTQPEARRDRLAIAAAPFMHPRREPVGQGKRDKAKEDAERAADLFKPGRSPLKAVA
jgi:hypothetical protein